MKRSPSDTKENQYSLTNDELGRLRGKHPEFSEDEVDKIAARLYFAWHWKGSGQKGNESEIFQSANVATRKRFRRLAVEVLIMVREIFEQLKSVRGEDYENQEDANPYKINWKEVERIFTIIQKQGQ